MTKDKFKKIKILLPFLLSIFIFVGFAGLALSAPNGEVSLKVSRLGDGFGSVTISSSATNDLKCDFNKNDKDSYCRGNYPKGVEITITAVADSGSKFIEWSGKCSGGSSDCTRSISSDSEVSAYFSLGSGNNNSSPSSLPDGDGGPYTLTLKKGTSSGTGWVEIINASKTCYMRADESSCSYTYSAGSSVELRIVPDGGMEFSVSGGGCSISSTDCNVTMNNNKTVTVDFTLSSDPAPKINFFYADPVAVKKGGTSVLHGQVANVSRCHLMSRDDSSVGAYSWPPILKEWEYQGNPPYYWRDVDKNFTWTTASLTKEGTYSYELICRGEGSYDNQFRGKGIINNYLSVDVMTNVTLNVTKSGGGAGTVKSDTSAPSFAWANNGLVMKGEPRYTEYGSCNSYVKTYSCNSLTLGTKVYDGSGMGDTYGAMPGTNAFPVYDGLKTATVREYSYGSCSPSFRSGGTVNEWQCKDKVYDIDCGIMCSASYAFGDNKKITLTATPNSGSSFSKWTGATCGEGTNNKSACTVTMNGTRNVNAEFIVCASCASSSSSASLETVFSFTGAEQKYTVPAGVSSLKITAYGAKGGGNISNSGYGGYGGKTTATISVTPGEILYVYVGGTNGWNGGGYGGTSVGGGASDIRKGGTGLANRIIVAGGGGGHAGTRSGGAGGGLTGTAGQGPYAGGGASQVSGGIGGGCYGELCGGGDNTAGLAGSLGIGGLGATVHIYGGGGGGGYYGGGGGGDSWQDGDQMSGGGGGSSYIDSKATNSSTQSGVNYGAGEVIITIVN